MTPLSKVKMSRGWLGTGRYNAQPLKQRNMIGVFCGESEREAAKEFFELFKTPWEFIVDGHDYPVVISTLPEAVATNANLVVVYSSKPTWSDTLKGLSIQPAAGDCLIDPSGARLPIYGESASLRGPGQPLIYDQSGSEVMVMGFPEARATVLRVGYDLFSEVAYLLSEGQPAENALIPTLESHASLLRDWIVDAGIPVIEIPPAPWGHRFIACLTHDVDFVGIRRHKFDHTFWGFIYRALAGSLWELVRGKSSLRRVIKNWTAVVSLPLVYLGLRGDFWDEFTRYAEVDKTFSSTFFLIPFRDRAGSNLQVEFPNRRAARYDIGDVHKQVEMLIMQGYEVGLHGIDAWHSAEKGRQELDRICEVTGQRDIGVRMHWLCSDHNSPTCLDQAGFAYDSTFGYNKAAGYRAGTLQVFRPSGATRLLELPLHIQDTALFLAHGLGLAEDQAWDRCMTIMDTAARYGGVVTVLWHMRSLSPERLWGDFYLRLLEELRKRGAWFGTARQVVHWFRQRRSVVFEEASWSEDTLRLRLTHDSCSSDSRLLLRVHRPRGTESAESGARPPYIDLPWAGETCVEIPLR
jgi:hypothetical protein